MNTLAPEMLRQYRATCTPAFREQVDSFKAMSPQDQAELMYFMLAYVGQQYVALRNMAFGIETAPPTGRTN